MGPDTFTFEPTARGRMDHMRSLKRTLAHLPVLPQEELSAISEAMWATTDEQERLRLRNSIVEHNMRLVFSIAEKYPSRGLEFEDRIGQGTLGLIRAAEKYEPWRHLKFSTYATFWIHQKIQNGIAEMGRLISVPREMLKQHRDIRQTEDVFLSVYGRAATDEEIADRIGLPIERVHECRRAMALRATAIDAPVQAEDGESDPDFLRLVALPSTSDDAFAARTDLLREIVNEAPLSERERHVVVAHFGLEHGTEPQELTAISRRLSVSHQAIGQNKDRALAKLQCWTSQNPSYVRAYELTLPLLAA